MVVSRSARKYSLASRWSVHAFFIGKHADVFSSAAANPHAECVRGAFNAKANHRNTAMKMETKLKAACASTAGTSEFVFFTPMQSTMPTANVTASSAYEP